MESGDEQEINPTQHTGVFIPSTGQVRDDDTFRILVATDIHLGYCDNNPSRGGQSKF